MTKQELEAKDIYEKYLYLEGLLKETRSDVKKLPKKMKEIEKNLDILYDFSRSKEWEKYGKILSDYGHKNGFHLEIFNEDSIFEVIQEFDKIKKRFY